MDNLRGFPPQTGTGKNTGREMDTRMELEHPLLGHYRLDRELGRGFSSIVYEATDLRRQRVTALKVLTFLQTLSEDRRVDLAARFRREAQAVSALSHPNIVAIYEVGQADDERQYIAMECLPGETLRRRLLHAAPLSVAEAVAIATRVADALHYAHGRGIVHRDVKPDNIFLAGGIGAEATPKLMDFGIAHVLADQGLTQDGTIVGSPAYMSPEQINGQPLDARTDIFSLAVTLTEMVTGVKPFEGETIPAVMQQILRHTPDLRAVPDRRLERVLTKALSKNPGARYPDADAFAQALRQAAPLAAAAPSVATQFVMGLPQPHAPALQKKSNGRLGIVGMGAIALAALAALPLVTRRPSSPAYAASPVSQIPAQSLLAAPTRLALGPGTQHHLIAASWRPATPRPIPPADTEDMVKIAEVTPVPHRLFDYAHTVRTPSVTQTPKPSHATRPPTPMVSTTHAQPIIRAAGIRQKLIPAQITPSAIPVTGLTADAPTPPAHTQALADTPPLIIHSPMPSAVADMDSPDATVRLRLSVDVEGDVTEATILTSSGSQTLDDAALEAVSHWAYDPALKNGRSVAGTVIETVKFSQH